MKITYEFDTLDENFDIHELKRVQKALDMAACISHIENYLRGLDKYETRDAIPVSEILDKIYEIIDDDNINIEDLYN